MGRTTAGAKVVGVKVISVAAVVATVAVALLVPAAHASDCPVPPATAAYSRSVMAALASPRDVWGGALLAEPGGPTAAGAQRYLAPLLLARGPKQRPLTASGVYYLPFADPPVPQGAPNVQLHVADGGQLVARRVGGLSLTVFVGAGGGERWGSCLDRLAPAVLRDGWLPVLETAYVDAGGARYRQESFAAHVPGTSTLASFVSLAVDAREAGEDVLVGLQPSAGRPLALTIPQGTTRDVVFAWPPLRTVDASTYERVRDALEHRWRARLAEGAQISVPEQQIVDAERALLVQNMVLGWRYSIGNSYEEFSFPEGPDLARVMGELGYADVDRAILETSLTQSSKGYTSWKDGERLLDSAVYYRTFADRAYVERSTPALASFLASLERAFGRDGHGLLARERYSADTSSPIACWRSPVSFGSSPPSCAAPSTNGTAHAGSSSPRRARSS